MRHLLDGQQSELRDHINTLKEEARREIRIFYSELKLRLPTYLKSVTLDQLREAGFDVNPHIGIPRDAEERLRKYVLLRDKVKEVKGSFKAQVISYYANLKREIPGELRKKQLECLSNEEWARFHIDMALVKK